MDSWKRFVQEALFSQGEPSELFRISYVSPRQGPRSSTQEVGELVFADTAVCFVLHHRYRYHNIWSFLIQTLYVILITLGAAFLTPEFGLAGGILGGAIGALVGYIVHILLRRRSERNATVGIEEMVRRQEKKGLEDAVAFSWRETITNIEVKGDRLILSWKEPSRPISSVELRLLGTLDADLQTQIRSYVSKAQVG
ncbi:MAG: hypothetical protein JSW58_13075 [Candidatus Latescibacterota bacterium]|nr:MAG: hypothetical protein JSW58_13075 [Candidatus Latescibacterota bacterium]